MYEGGWCFKKDAPTGLTRVTRIIHVNGGGMIFSI
jgi:hypothetical protein